MTDFYLTLDRMRRDEPAKLAAFAVAAIGLLVLLYNRLVALRQVTNQAWADVEVQLKQRHDLIPNLVETVKGYAAHERGTLDEVIRARNAAASAQGPAAAAAAEGALSGALGRLFALSEAYPDLKANQNFLSLQGELSDVENKIAAARRFFNNRVAEYNTAIQSVPAAIGEGALGDPLAAIQSDFADVKIGSYPHMGHKVLMTSLVLRSADVALAGDRQPPGVIRGSAGVARVGVFRHGCHAGG